ncbi:MAG TPA: PaaI family thioesterase [Candidatus Acidoferrales bacterium]|nr:PaaI family thioesterase [Candidatus Acidoferrales bacterium]
MTQHEMKRAANVGKPLTLVALGRRFHFSNTARQFGFRLESAEVGRAKLRMNVQPRHMQIHGVVHGGVLASLADTAGGLALYLALPRGSRAATVEMKINFLEPVQNGTVFAEARILRQGKYLAVLECDLTDERGRMVAKALMTFSVGAAKQAKRR